MQLKKALVDVVGKFTPKLVKMCVAETNTMMKPSKREVVGRKCLTYNVMIIA